MCDICNSIFGHLDNCPERSLRSDVYCCACENQLGSDETIVTFPDGSVFCGECVRGFDMYDLCLYLDVDNALELIEKFGVCKITQLGRWQ